MKTRNTQWQQMEAHLLETKAHCAWQVEQGMQLLECWVVRGMPVVFLIYPGAGFDVFTSNRAPDKIDEILPWLEAEAEACAG